jgi:glycosyltransferase involved in cell wall biosynthesis
MLGDRSVLPLAVVKGASVYLGLTVLSIFVLLVQGSSVHSSVALLPVPDLPVSIIIPSFHRDRYLQRAVRSALNQTLSTIEVVVIDDCSQDSSVPIIRRMMAEDSRVRLVRHTVNSGTHAARITGVKCARGKFVLSLDPDDELYPFIAEDAVHFALLHGVDIVEFHALEVVGGRAHQFDFLNPPSLRGDGDCLARMFSGQAINWNLWKRLIRRTVYLRAINILTPRIRSKRIIYAEDKLHIGLICLVANGFYFLKEPGYIYYRDNPDNSESGAQQTSLECLRQLRYVEKTLKYFYLEKMNLTFKLSEEMPVGLTGN